MRYYGPETPRGFVEGLEVGLSRGVLDTGVLRKRLVLVAGEYEGSCWGRKQNAVRVWYVEGVQGMARGGHPSTYCPQDLCVCFS